MTILRSFELVLILNFLKYSRYFIEISIMLYNAFPEPSQSFRSMIHLSSVKVIFGHILKGNDPRQQGQIKEAFISYHLQEVTFTPPQHLQKFASVTPISTRSGPKRPAADIRGGGIFWIHDFIGPIWFIVRRLKNSSLLEDYKHLDWPSFVRF